MYTGLLWQSKTLFAKKERNFFLTIIFCDVNSAHTLITFISSPKKKNCCYLKNIENNSGEINLFCRYLYFQPKKNSSQSKYSTNQTILSTIPIYTIINCITTVVWRISSTKEKKYHFTERKFLSFIHSNSNPETALIDKQTKQCPIYIINHSI